MTTDRLREEYRVRIDHALPEARPLLHAALDAALSAREDPATLDAFVSTALDLWDIRLGVAGMELLQDINDLAFGKTAPSDQEGRSRA